MVVRRSIAAFKRSLLGFLVTFFLIAPNAIAAENYGACTYSSGDYSSTTNCDSTTSPVSNLSGTGENQKQLLILALSLLVGLLGVTGVIVIIMKTRKKSDE
jgi:hypothetical protein